jgi:hypothetical protein
VAFWFLDVIFRVAYHKGGIWFDILVPARRRCPRLIISAERSDPDLGFAEGPAIPLRAKCGTCLLKRLEVISDEILRIAPMLR